MRATASLPQQAADHGFLDASEPGRPCVQVAISTPGTFHSFDMARQLHLAGMLAGIHTGYPRFKLRNTDIPATKIQSFPWIKGPYMAGWVPGWLRRDWEVWDKATFDAYVSATLPDCDVFCGLSGSALRSGRRAQQRGARFVCDRGSSHIRVQDALLREEYARWALPYRGVDKRVIDMEEAEYEQADAILVPSQFAYRSFVKMGVSSGKLRLAPYGVDLSRFAQVAVPARERFDMLFVGGLSVRKGAHYLLSAYDKVVHPKKSLTIAGIVSTEIAPMLEVFAARHPEVAILGHVPQAHLKECMSRSHVLILPSVEEGFGLVQAQAMACGCPVVASSNTGAADLFTDGKEGFIFPAGDLDALTLALQKLADSTNLQRQLSQACLHRVKALGGWTEYGATVRRVFQEIVLPTLHKSEVATALQ